MHVQTPLLQLAFAPQGEGLQGLGAGVGYSAVMDCVLKEFSFEKIIYNLLRILTNHNLSTLCEWISSVLWYASTCRYVIMHSAFSIQPA